MQENILLHLSETDIGPHRSECTKSNTFFARLRLYSNGCLHYLPDSHVSHDRSLTDMSSKSLDLFALRIFMPLRLNVLVCDAIDYNSLL